MATKTTRHCSAFANIGKLQTIKDINTFVLNIKNAMSLFCFQHINELASSKTLAFANKYYKNFCSQNAPISNWEIQQVFIDVTTRYRVHIKKLFENKRIQVQNSITYDYYKQNYKDKKKGDLKSKEITYRPIKTKLATGKLVTSPIVPLLKYLIHLEDPTTVVNPDILERLNTFDENKRNRILALAKQIRENLLARCKLITFHTGTYLKDGYLTSAKKKETIIEDLTNTKYQLWYIYKTRFNDIYIPLQLNKKYHKQFNKNRCHLVKVTGNKIQILTTIDTADPFFKDVGRAIGIDVNVKHNLLSTSDGEFVDYDRDFVKKIVKMLQKYDKQKKTEEERLKTNKKTQKLTRKAEWYFRYLIFKFLNDCEKKGITDIVMEDLSLSDKTFILNKEFNVKYSRLIRLLRLANLKNWFLQQAEKRGIRVHTTPAYYTSQQCNVCGCIDRENRQKQEEFSCVECGHTDNADLNAAKNIFLRYSADVLRNNGSMHTFDAYGRMVAKEIRYRYRATVRKAVQGMYAFNS